MYQKYFQKYKSCLVRITIITEDGDLSNGTAFHIGDGYLVTARHVVEGKNIHEICGETYNENVNCEHIYYPDNPKIDLAVLKTDFTLDYYMTKVKIHNAKYDKIDRIEIGGHLDDWIGDEFVLSKVLIMGFPPIPFSDRPVLVAAEAEVNSVIDMYINPHPHFVVSAMPRGGFSGGPVISEYGFLLGVITESVYANESSYELGYNIAVSVEPIFDLLHKNKIYIKGNDEIIRTIYDGGNERE